MTKFLKLIKNSNIPLTIMLKIISLNTLTLQLTSLTIFMMNNLKNSTVFRLISLKTF